MLSSTVRRAAAVTTEETKTNKPQEPLPNTVAANEADSNADTCCLGQNFVVLQYTNRVADVYAYNKSLKPVQNVPIVSGATAYDCPKTRSTYILVVNEALYYGTQLDHSLLNPNQLRSYGVDFWDNPFDTDRPLCIDINRDVQIPLVTTGTKVQFKSRVPTTEELKSCPHLQLTSKAEWNPSTLQMTVAQVTQQQEIPWKRTICGVASNTTVYLDPTSDEALLNDVESTLVNLNDGRTIQETTIYDDDTMDLPVRRTFIATDRHTTNTAESLAERFGIGLQRARETLKATLQRGMRSAILPIARRFRADRYFSRRRLNGKFSSDTAFFKYKSLRGNIASQIFFHKCGFATAYHVSRVNDAAIGPTLNSFCHDWGVPNHLTIDGANVQVGRHTQFNQALRDNEIDYHISHPYSPQENPAEGGIREIKRRFYRYMEIHKIPMRLWDYVLDYTLEIMQITVPLSRYANKRTPIETITGITPDISEWLDFTIYEWCFYKTNAGVGPRELGRWLGVSHRVGPAMTYWVLPKSGLPISCDTVQRVTREEQQTEAVRQLMAEWTEKTKAILYADGSRLSERTIATIPKTKAFDIDDENEDFQKEFHQLLNDTTLPEMDDIVETIETTDNKNYLNMEVDLHRNDDETRVATGRVVRQKVDEKGKPMGTAHDNPMLDTRQYEVAFDDGHVEVYSANVLAESILAQVDDLGHKHRLLDEIIGHRFTAEAIPRSKGTVQTPSGATRKIKTTKGCEICLRWKGGQMHWFPLKDIKDSFSVELATYARDNHLLTEPVFAWWAPFALKKAARILSKIKSKHWERTHKFGLRVPRTIQEAKEIDKENNNTEWMDAVALEMTNARIAFEEHEGDVRQLVGFEEITGHIIFDIRMGENFRKKARFVADGHKTKTPIAVTYSSVVSRDSVRLLLLVAAINDIQIKGADIQNAFLSAPNREKCYIIAGPEFGPDEGKTFIVRRALYGLKSAAASFRAYMAEHLDGMGFKSSPADPDVWLRPAVKSNGAQYYEYFMAYVDDILAVSENPDDIMNQIKKRFKLKDDKVEPPTTYLGARLQERKLDGRSMWTMTSADYITAALKNVQNALQKSRKWKIPTTVRGPMATNFVPELDGSPELNETDATLYREFIGILRWSIEIGRVDILHEVALLSQYQAVPREGHMEQVLHIFGYLKKKQKLTLYFDPRLPNVDYKNFKTNQEEFRDHYRDAVEEIPHKMPKPRGIGVQISAFVDASHGSNKKTRRSHTGYLIFVNSAPILWYSKKQSTVESSTFSAEMIAMRTCFEAIVHLRYKLRMFGIPLLNNAPASVFCDNESCVKNTSQFESTLNKKHVSIAYHYIRWHVAAGIAMVAWIEGSRNLADPYTKRLPEATRDHLFGDWTY